MIEVQTMAAALGFSKKLVLVAMALDSDPKVPGAKTKLIPSISNLALVRARVACLSGQPCDALEEVQPKEIKLSQEPSDLLVVRITGVIRYIAQQKMPDLRLNPHHALRLMGVRFDAKIYKWEAVPEAFAGYAVIPASKLRDILPLSGTEGIFATQLSKPQATWIPRREGKSDMEYFQLALEAARAAKVAEVGAAI